MSLNWREHFPYKIPRNNQEEVLDLLEKQWDNYDYFIIQAPTAFGKSAIAKTLLSSQKSASYITPTNQLLNQFLEEFPETPTLSRLDSYHCEEWNRSCSITRARKKQFCSMKRGDCSDCPASKDLARAKYRSGPGAYNYHIYIAHKLYRNVLIVDEAHNLIPHITSRMGLHLYQHDYKYPNNMYTTGQMLEWLGTQPDRIRKHKKVTMMEAALRSRSPEYVVNRARRMFNGKGTVRGEPEERDCIELLPVDISKAPALFWPREVKKTVLLSATINEQDVKALGIRGRVCYIACKSPIPAEARPIVVDPITNVNRSNLTESAARMSEYIQNVLARRHAGEKGIVHASYAMASLMHSYLGRDSRFLFHDRNNKQEIYSKFRKAAPESGVILVASGMYEGIDLPEDLGRWQVISKIPWMSLGNPAIRYLADAKPEWYIWDCLRTTIQACGRICRTPQDYGITYILDGTFDRLFQDGHKLMPQWFQDALHNADNYLE